MWDVHPGSGCFPHPVSESRIQSSKKDRMIRIRNTFKHRIFLSAKLTSMRQKKSLKKDLNFTSFRRTSTCRRCERGTTGEKCATSLACRAFFMRRHDGFTASAVPRGAYCIVRGGAHSASGAHHQWRKLTVPDIRIWRLWIVRYAGISFDTFK